MSENTSDSSSSWIASEAEETLDPSLESDNTITNLRPTAFDDYIGQKNILESLKIACNAASNRGECLDHLLFYGPPGLGKTSLARIIAKELGANFKGTSGPVIERPGDLAAMLTSMEANTVLFIDEIHRLPRVVEEILYPAMEDYEIDILIGQGPAAKSVKIPLKPFTLIGATTRSGLLTSPLRDRFGITSKLDYYTPQELEAIVSRSAKILDVEIETDAALEIGHRSRGTPRIANKILKRVRDYAQEKSDGKIDQKTVESALKLLDIDQQGLTQVDRLLLRVIVEKFNYGPVGIDTLATALSEEKETIEDVYEPYLIQSGLLARTPRGRTVTNLACEYLGLKPPKQENQNLNLFK